MHLSTTIEQATKLQSVIKIKLIGSGKSRATRLFPDSGRVFRQILTIIPVPHAYLFITPSFHQIELSFIHSSQLDMTTSVTTTSLRENVAEQNG
jgi:hypothetical protein